MSINLADKYASQIAAVFSANSFLNNNTNKEFSFSGVKSLTIMTPVTQDLVDYQRSGTQRYGEPKEIQDTVQELPMSQDKAFSMTIDKGNLNDQLMLKQAGRMLAMEKKEKVVPAIDKYTLGRWAKLAGTVTGTAAPQKNSIVGLLSDASAAMDDNLVPAESRYLYIGAQYYKLLRMAPEFLSVDSMSLDAKALTKGLVGEVMDMKVIKIPTSYLPADCYFLITHSQSVIQASKIAEARYHTDPPGISGALLEGRYYFDAFVLGAKANGVYAAVSTSSVSAVPAVAVSGGEATITGSGTLLYTIDGSDPRYSKKVLTYSAPVQVTAGTVVKAVSADPSGAKYPSAVASATA